MIFDIDNWKEIGATLARNKTRTFLTAFGIFWGTAMLAMLAGGAEGLNAQMRRNFDGFATNSAVVFPQRTTLPYKGFQKGMSWNLTIEDVENIRANMPEFEVVSPIINSNSTTLKYRDKTYTAQIGAYEPNYTKVMEPIIISGRFINEADISNCAKSIVLGANVASNLFGSADPVGEMVECDNIFYRVVGVVKQRSDISVNGRLDNQAIIPFSTGQRLYNLGNTVHFMMMVAANGHNPTELRDRMYRILRSNHPLHPDDKDNLFFMDISEIFKQIDSVFLGVNILILFVGFSSLLAGIIGVGNIMWIVVKERTQEFGIRRAIGAKPRSIMEQIMCESAVLTAIAGTAGICFAVGVLQIAANVIAATADTPMTPAETGFQLHFSTAIIIMVIFLVLGGLAGSIPAIKAMRIKPIEALNDK